MDDKEKEKFGVIIDKNDQDKNDQPKVESDNKNVETEQVQETNIKSNEEKQPEIDNSTENSENSSNENNLAENNEDQIKNETTADDKITENADEKKEHQVIHKKDGRLHIYVRQDKYKGELKSKNWVGRLYIDGKQKISSSGTPNLEEAIPILEKWFDDVHAEKEKEQNQPEQSSSENVINDVTPENLEKTTAEVIPNETNLSNPQETIVKENLTEKITETKQETQDNISINQTEVSNDEEQSKVKNIFNKLKNIKFKAPSFGKQNTSSPKLNFDKNKVKEKFNNFIKSKLGKKTAQGEEIVGVEITGKEIRLTQISSNKANQWVLEKFYVHPIDLPDDAAIIEHEKKVSEELNVALQKSKISTPNAAIAIPVTNAIIRVVTAPLMNDEELKKAIDTNSLWENLVQLTDNLDDYSIFHQVINRNSKDNTMDILFVASKLADINNYTNIIKNSGLNPVIIDVKCFALKSAVDQINQISKNAEDANLTAVLEFGLDENYLMILYENNPIITDIFIRNQDREILQNSQDQEEKEALVRRFITQVKQAVQDFETKYEKRIRNIKVVSDLVNVEDYLSTFRKSLANVGFNLFDPIDGLKIPQQNVESTNLQNRSYLSTVIGLAFRKLDVFGYYKFVTAVKNINLLPDRAGMIKQKKMKAFSKFAFKGVAGAVLAIYTLLFGLSFWQIYSYNSKLQDYDKIAKEHKLRENQKKKFSKELGVMTKTLQLSKTLKSNKSLSYRYLAQIAMSVPKRVKFNSIQYDGKKSITLLGSAATDQDILKLINNLNTQKLVQQASLGSMNLPKSKAGSNIKKGFKILVQVKG